jgi:hypothetical protein
MTIDHSYYRTELHVLQNVCHGDNEKFLNAVATIIGNLTAQRDRFATDL